MTVAELIVELQKWPPTALVWGALDDEILIQQEYGVVDVIPVPRGGAGYE